MSRLCFSSISFALLSHDWCIIVIEFFPQSTNPHSKREGRLALVLSDQRTLPRLLIRQQSSLAYYLAGFYLWWVHMRSYCSAALQWDMTRDVSIMFNDHIMNNIAYNPRFIFPGTLFLLWDRLFPISFWISHFLSPFWSSVYQYDCQWSSKSCFTTLSLVRECFSICLWNRFFDFPWK